MNKTTISVAELAKDFLGVLARVEHGGEPAIIVRDGKAVASLNPLPSLAGTCAELADLWPTLGKLSQDEANAFADDIENSRAGIPPIKPAWD